LRPNVQVRRGLRADEEIAVALVDAVLRLLRTGGRGVERGPGLLEAAVLKPVGGEPEALLLLRSHSRLGDDEGVVPNGGYGEPARARGDHVSAVRSELQLIAVHDGRALRPQAVLVLEGPGRRALADVIRVHDLGVR